MSDTATTERPNKVQVTDAGPSRKRISIEIPAETVTEKLAESFETLAVEAAVPGFRKGRVPRSLVERKFGATVRQEAKNQLIASAYSRAVEEHGLKVLGDPSSEEVLKAELVSGQPFAFEVEVEVLPEFELPALEGIRIMKPTFDVSDELVDEEIEKLRINEGDLEERDVAEPGDYVTGHAIMVGGSDNEEFYNLDGAVVQVPKPEAKGKGMILGILLDDLGKQLGSPKPGDELTIRAKGPEQHEIEGIRNADLTITYKIQRVDRIIPADAEKVASLYGFESVDALKQGVRERLNQRARIQQDTAMRQQVAKHLIEAVRMDLPERLTANQAARWLQQRRLELMYRGLDEASIEQQIAELRGSSSQAAQNELKLFFILNKAAEVMKVQVTEAEINGRIAQMAYERQVRPEKLRQDIIRNNQVGPIYQQVREHKTLDAIVKKAEVEEVTADEFNRRIQAGG